MVYFFELFPYLIDTNKKDFQEIYYDDTQGEVVNANLLVGSLRSNKIKLSPSFPVQVNIDGTVHSIYLLENSKVIHLKYAI